MALCREAQDVREERLASDCSPASLHSSLPHVLALCDISASMHKMTQVDFYILESTQDDVSRLACRLTEKAWKEGNRIFIHTSSEAAAAALDKLLWTFRQGSFIPHALASEVDDTVSISIGQGEAPTQPAEVLINCGDNIPAFFNHFDRVLEAVAGDDDSLQAGRARYRDYQTREITPIIHKI